MNTLKPVLIMLLFSLSLGAFAQEQEEWQPQLNVTGYVNSIAEWTDQDEYKDINENIGIGLAEVGFLASFKPIEKLELKSTLVYKHKVADLQSMLVEAYGIYTFSEQFKVGLGKFLTPLSPVNTYFYAPVNPSVVLPMVVSHYVLTPQSISGLQIAGSVGNEFKLSYNLTYGNYTTLGHVRNGIIGLQGGEDLAGIDPAADNADQNYDLGGSARLEAKYKFITVGANYFDGTRATLAYADFFAPVINDSDYQFKSRKWSTGADVHINLFDYFKINAEYWIGENETTDLRDQLGVQDEIKIEYDGYYAELVGNFGKFQPYVRYEELSDVRGILFAGDPQSADPTMGQGYNGIPHGTLLGVGSIDISSMGVGMAYRPFYELLLKVDYRRLENTTNDGQGNITKDPFNNLIFSAVYSF